MIIFALLLLWIIFNIQIAQYLFLIGLILNLATLLYLLINNFINEFVFKYPDGYIQSGLDDDLISLDRQELISEIVRLRQGIREHRNNSGHNLCWSVPELWNLLPEKIEPNPEVPPTEEFLSKCAEYRKSLD